MSPGRGVALAAGLALAGLIAAVPARPQAPVGPAQPAQPARPAEPQRPVTAPSNDQAELARRPRPQPTFEQMVQMRAVLQRPDEDSAAVRRDLVYTTVDGRALRFDLYLPPGPARPRAAIVFASGASDARSWAVFRSYGRLATTMGMAGIVYEKRYERSQLREGLADTEALFDFLRERGASLGVNPSRLVLWAFSAGGRLLSVGINPRRSEIRAMVGFYPVLDLTGELAFYPDSLRERVRLSGSPSDLFETRPRALPPTLIVRAGLDAPLLQSGIARFVRIGLEQNAPIELVNVPEGRHAFDLLDDMEDSRRAIARALEFAKERAGTR